MSWTAPLRSLAASSWRPSSRRPRRWSRAPAVLSSTSADRSVGPRPTPARTWLRRTERSRPRCSSSPATTRAALHRATTRPPRDRRRRSLPPRSARPRRPRPQLPLLGDCSSRSAPHDPVRDARVGDRCLTAAGRPAPTPEDRTARAAVRHGSPRSPNRTGPEVEAVLPSFPLDCRPPKPPPAPGAKRCVARSGDAIPSTAPAGDWRATREVARCTGLALAR